MLVIEAQHKYQILKESLHISKFQIKNYKDNLIGTFLGTTSFATLPAKIFTHIYYTLRL